MFAYSAREGTAAAKLTDDIPRKVKLARLSSLIALQTVITGEIYNATIGRELEVLITGRARRNGTGCGWARIAAASGCLWRAKIFRQELF